MKQNENINLEPANERCYICGRSVEEFKKYFKYDTMEDLFETENSDLKSKLNIENQEYFSQFVDKFGNEFFEFYANLMKLPEGVDKLGFSEFKSQKAILIKMFPEIASFDAKLLNYWGIGRIQKRGNTTTIGTFKEYCSQIYNDLKNKKINWDIIRTISNRMRENPNSPTFLRALLENSRKVDASSYHKLPEISFSKKTFSFKTTTLKISYSYYMCLVCRKIDQNEEEIKKIKKDKPHGYG